MRGDLNKSLVAKVTKLFIKSRTPYTPSHTTCTLTHPHTPSQIMQQTLIKDDPDTRGGDFGDPHRALVSSPHNKGLKGLFTQLRVTNAYSLFAK